MKRVFLFIVLCVLFLLTGCRRQHIEVDASLTSIADYIKDNCSLRISVSAHDGRRDHKPIITLGVIVYTEDVEEQYVIVNSVIKSIDEYLITHDDIEGSLQELLVCFVLPDNQFSGVPGDALCEVTNRSENGVFENSLVEIRPLEYGIEHINESRLVGDNVEHTIYSIYEVPDSDFPGIHIMRVQWDIEDELIDEYLSSWPSIDIVYVDTSERAEELHDRYPDITFIGSDTNENG